MAKQLIYFHQQDIDGGNGHNSHIKAFFLHHLLDYFKETRINISNINAVFEIFLKEKIEIEIITNNGKKVNFLNEIHQIFDFLRKNKEELYSDLKGGYFSSLKIRWDKSTSAQQIYLMLPFELILEIIVKNIYLISLR